MRGPVRSTLCAVAAVTVLASCNRYSEAEMRDRVADFFTLGPTLSFRARIECSAGAFRLMDDSIGARMVVEPRLVDMIDRLGDWAIVAVDDPTLTPDAAMIEAANYARDKGMAMRRAVLEARACMDDQLATEFGRMLSMPEAIFAYDSETPSVMIIDDLNRVLVVARGSL